jgi:hypothetical protein
MIWLVIKESVEVTMMMGMVTITTSTNTNML